MRIQPLERERECQDINCSRSLKSLLGDDGNASDIFENVSYRKNRSLALVKNDELSDDQSIWRLP